MKSCLLFLTSLLIITSLQAEPPQSKDWLVNPEGFKSRIRESQAKRELILENGLAQRVIRLHPNAATVSLLNQVSGENLLRATGPEARVKINGTEYAIGGLEGQPIKNYLKPEWIDSLVATPESYQFASWKEGPIEARFPWKKRAEWSSRDLPWPPPGRHLTLTFTPPASAPKTSDPVLLEERFVKPLSEDWKLHVSPKLAHSSFSNEGKVGEIFTLPDTSVFAERDWPEQATSLEVTVNAGDDQKSNSWGPGLALIAGNRTISVVARPSSGQYEIFDGTEKVAGKFDRSKSVILRARLQSNRIYFETSQDEGKSFARLGEALFPKPSKLRIGKVGKGGRGEDYPDAKGEPVRCRIERVTLRGTKEKQPEVPRTDLPNVEVHYEIYDGLPLLSKWLVVRNSTKAAIRIDSFVSEEVRLAEVESNVEAVPDRERPNLWVETDYAFGAMDAPHAMNKSVFIESDPDYPTQVHYERKTPCLLQTKLAQGPDQEVASGGVFETFRTFELLLDSTERERRGLAQRRMYRTIAPWTAENPLMFHVRRADSKSLHAAIQQAHEVGFELLIMTFGSGFNFESRDPKYQETYKALVQEAKSKGLALGGYSLLASRGAANKKDNTQGLRAMYGVMPCLCAKWGMEYLEQIKGFIAHAELGVLEHDGSYPGDQCNATEHVGHRGLHDSQWVQWRAITNLYKWCRAEGVYLNIPDWYFLMGGNKCGMGYRENNWSLPRAEQELIERQNIFDGTWTKTNSMGWMMVPLTEYQGGGKAATIEPLHEHLDHYEARLANLLGAGVQACFRGPRLFDTDATKAMVKKWVEFYKSHRQVLDGDLIHLRRANGRDWDGWLHVNPQGKEKGMAFFYNPLSETIEREIRIPLHYTGLSETAQVSVEGAAPTRVALDRTESITVKVKIPAHGRTWLLLTESRN